MRGDTPSNHQGSELPGPRIPFSFHARPRFLLPRPRHKPRTLELVSPAGRVRCGEHTTSDRPEPRITFPDRGRRSDGRRPGKEDPTIHSQLDPEDLEQERLLAQLEHPEWTDPEIDAYIREKYRSQLRERPGRFNPVEEPGSEGIPWSSAPLPDPNHDETIASHPASAFANPGETGAKNTQTEIPSSARAPLPYPHTQLILPIHPLRDAHVFR